MFTPRPSQWAFSSGQYCLVSHRTLHFKIGIFASCKLLADSHEYRQHVTELLLNRPNRTEADTETTSSSGGAQLPQCARIHAEVGGTATTAVNYKDLTTSVRRAQATRHIAIISP